MTAIEFKDMKLHETAMIGNYEVTRVPGGWIYCRYQNLMPVFVPISFEFSNREWAEQQ